MCSTEAREFGLMSCWLHSLKEAGRVNFVQSPRRRRNFIFLTSTEPGPDVELRAVVCRGQGGHRCAGGRARDMLHNLAVWQHLRHCNLSTASNISFKVLCAQRIHEAGWVRPGRRMRLRRHLLGQWKTVHGRRQYPVGAARTQCWMLTV